MFTSAQAILDARAQAEARAAKDLAKASYLVNCNPTGNGRPRVAYDDASTAQDWERASKERRDAHTAAINAALAPPETVQPPQQAAFTPNRGQGLSDQSAVAVQPESGSDKAQRLRGLHAAQRAPHGV